MINPRAVDGLQYQAELGGLFQLWFCLFAFVIDVIIEDLRDGFGSSVVVTQVF